MGDDDAADVRAELPVDDSRELGPLARAHVRAVEQRRLLDPANVEMLVDQKSLSAKAPPGPKWSRS